MSATKIRKNAVLVTRIAASLMFTHLFHHLHPPKHIPFWATQVGQAASAVAVQGSVLRRSLPLLQLAKVASRAPSEVSFGCSSQASDVLSLASLATDGSPTYIFTAICYFHPN